MYLIKPLIEQNLLEYYVRLIRLLFHLTCIRAAFGSKMVHITTERGLFHIKPQKKKRTIARWSLHVDGVDAQPQPKSMPFLCVEWDNRSAASPAKRVFLMVSNRSPSPQVASCCSFSPSSSSSGPTFRPVSASRGRAKHTLPRLLGSEQS